MIRPLDEEPKRGFRAMHSISSPDLKLLYFNGRGIYVVFCDARHSLDEAWQEFRFWLWAAARSSVKLRGSCWPSASVGGHQVGSQAFRSP